jgi:hypothetical protein
MELTDIEKDIQKDRSQLSALKAETKSCISWVGPNGGDEDLGSGEAEEPWRQDQILDKTITDKVELAASLHCVLGDRTVEEIWAQVLVAGNRIVEIKAQLDCDLKILVAKEIGIDKEHLVVGDHLFFQAGKEAVSRVLKGDEFTVLQQRAEEKIYDQNLIAVPDQQPGPIGGDGGFSNSTFASKNNTLHFISMIRVLMKTDSSNILLTFLEGFLCLTKNIHSPSVITGMRVFLSSSVFVRAISFPFSWKLP